MTKFTKIFQKLLIFSALILFGLNSIAWSNSEIITTKWNSQEGLEKLQSSQFKNDFYELADHFQPQINPLYCGIASSVIILNTINDGKISSQKELEVTKPQAFGGGNIEFKNYSQINFLNDKTDKIKDRKIINLQNITPENENDAKNFDPGVTLAELEKILSKVYKLKTTKVYADDNCPESIEKFRNIVKKVTSDKSSYLLANFKGSILGLATNGHISPIAAYDQNSDSALVMDVAGHKNGWYWVKIKNLYMAMNSKDGNKYRGYLIVEQK